MEQETTKTKPFKLNMTCLSGKYNIDFEGDEVAFQQLLDSLDSLNRQESEAREKRESREFSSDVIVNMGVICALILVTYLVVSMVTVITTTITNKAEVENVR